MKEHMLDICTAILSSPVSKAKFSNCLNIVELLLITSISNAVVKKMFSILARMKPHLSNRMSKERLDSLLRTSEEIPSVKDYDPAAAIECWYEQKEASVGYEGQ